MLNKEVKRIDIAHIPELLRLAEEVKKSNGRLTQLTILTMDGEDVLEVKPAKAARKSHANRGILTKDDPLFSIIGIGRSGVGDISSNKHKYLAEAYYDKHL
ncbi:MAG: hypothetical protein EXR50_03950 [Dehalococcoidia bacterium]|nr:hypothetical protein [Dehalococcoidia bacterium]